MTLRKITTTKEKSLGKLMPFKTNSFYERWTRSSRSTMLPLGQSQRPARSCSLSLFPSIVFSAQSHCSWYLCGSFFRPCSPCLYLTGLVLPQDRCSLGPVVARSSVNHTVKKRSQCYILMSYALPSLCVLSNLCNFFAHVNNLIDSIFLLKMN